MFRIKISKGDKVILQKTFKKEEDAYDYYDKCMLKFDHDYDIEFI